eukprot:Sspe_Gene.34776::Locus_16884_Transcript_1_1_Confidence_1.000_Length_749::g.34776::m.34776
MFLCQLILGEEGRDHTWVNVMKYYILKQEDCMVQALPQYLLQFAPSKSELAKTLEEETRGAPCGEEASSLKPCRDQTQAVVTERATRQLRLGWLDPTQLKRGMKSLRTDVQDFLKGHAVRSVTPHTSEGRLAAYVMLEEAIGLEQLADLNVRPYHGRYRITVDDASPDKNTGVCPQLAGPSSYCRGWNLGDNAAWYASCNFQHPAELSPLHKSASRLETVPRNTAKWDEVVGLMEKRMRRVQIVGMERI